MMNLIGLHENWYDMHWGNGWFIFPVIMMGFFIILILISLFGKRRHAWPWFNFEDYRHKGETSETALDILKKRYAQGEINKDEFDRIKKELLA